MTENVVARRYAKALFAVARKGGDGDLDAYGKDLAGLADVLAIAPEALGFFKNPTFDATEKKAVLGDLLGKLSVQPMVKNFCELLADKDRLPVLPDIAEVYKKMLEDAQGVVAGSLVTAIALPEARQSQIKDALAKKAGKTLALDFVVDADILGGVVLKVGDKVLDASLRAQLHILKEQIKRGE
ncbi:MAG: F0F1 ATP synthase subunit delta [Proteobacteria bacterium]|nr:F0F1 ATP synthase subunit delta [Pseudomonadota bacterium]MBU1610916.1 F0F1 ATP synthase subunit delta [Pseudomonadota bacterium]